MNNERDYRKSEQKILLARVSIFLSFWGFISRPFLD